MRTLAKLALAAEKVLVPLGGGGLFGAALLDSLFLPIAGGVDLWLISLCALRPERMALYALSAMTGSVIGCTGMYFAARKGREALVQRNRSEPRLDRIRALVERHGAPALLVAAILPPPAPFKLFVLAAALLELPYAKFVTALLAGRAIRYFVEGILSVRYGHQAWEWILQSGPVVLGCVLAALALLALAWRLIGQKSAVPSQKQESEVRPPKSDWPHS